MAALPYIQLYVADYLADTMHLTTEEHGAYLLLIMNYWQRGKPLDGRNERLASVARLSNERWQSVEKVLSEFFDIDDEMQWSHPRIEADLAKVAAKSKAAKRGGKASAAARKATNGAASERTLNERSQSVQRKGNHTDTDTDTDTEQKNPPTPQRGVDEFVTFWSSYPRKVAKPKAMAAWKKLTAAERQLAIEDVRRRARDDPQWIRDGGQFIPHPASYLNARRWLDEWKPGEITPPQRRSSARDDFEREIDDMLGLGQSGPDRDDVLLAERESGQAGSDRSVGQRPGRTEQRSDPPRYPVSVADR